MHKNTPSEETDMERCAVVPYEGERKYLFISYSHKDAARVVPIMERLEKEGYRIWYDEGIDPGSEWPETIADHLGAACACVGMISANYLASDNCRREMNFALKKQIPYLSVLLEEAEMSAGVEMQLSANQAIFKYKLPSEEAFYKKFNSTKFLQPAREVPQPAPIKEPAPVPAAVPAAAESPAPAAPEGAPRITAPQEKPEPKPEKTPKPKKQKPVKAKKEKKPRTKKQRLLRGLLIGVGAPVALIVLLFLIIFIRDLKQSKQPTAPADPTAWVKMFEADDYVKVFSGKKLADKYTDGAFENYMDFIDVNTEEGVYNLSVLPFSIDVPDTDTPVIRLGFTDRKNKEFTVEGQYEVTVSADAVTLSILPCESERTENALHPTDTIRYTAELSSLHLKLTHGESTKSLVYTAEQSGLSGSASTDRLYKEIGAVDVPDPLNGMACAVRFEDGGSAVDAKVDAAYPTLGSIYLKWTQRTKLYNGELQTFDENNTLRFEYINTAPHGFILIDPENDTAYLYQEPLAPDAADEVETEETAPDSGAEETETE